MNTTIKNALDGIRRKINEIEGFDGESGMESIDILLAVIDQLEAQGATEVFDLSPTMIHWQTGYSHRVIRVSLYRWIELNYLSVVRKPTQRSPDIRIRLGTELGGEVFKSRPKRVESKELFVPPTKEEIAEYFTHLTKVSGQAAKAFAEMFFTYYNDQRPPWTMKGGGKITSWKSAMASTWRKTVEEFAATKYEEDKYKSSAPIR